MIADKQSVIGEWYRNHDRTVYKSSLKSYPHSVKWYRRPNNKEDPWISLTDHHSAIEAGDIVYGENDFAGTHAEAVLPACKGADVFVRKIGNNQVMLNLLDTASQRWAFG